MDRPHHPNSAMSIGDSRLKLGNSPQCARSWYGHIVHDFVIRSATLADISQAAALGAEIVRLHHANNPKRFFMLDEVEQGYAWWLTQEIERTEAVVLVAIRNDVVVGYAYGAMEERDWSILADRHGAFHDLCVAATVRRQGIGRALARAMITRLEQLGSERILLRTMVENESAQRLATELGFLPTMLEMTRERSEEPVAP